MAHLGSMVVIGEGTRPVVRFNLFGCSAVVTKTNVDTFSGQNPTQRRFIL